jgi:hypothetical protein
MLIFMLLVVGSMVEVSSLYPDVQVTCLLPCPNFHLDFALTSV